MGLIQARCSRCSARLHKGRYVYSRYTGNHYCLDFKACTRRMKRALSKREGDEHGLTAVQDDQAGSSIPAAPPSRSESVEVPA